MRSEPPAASDGAEKAQQGAPWGWGQGAERPFLRAGGSRLVNMPAALSGSAGTSATVRALGLGLWGRGCLEGREGGVRTVDRPTQAGVAPC